jgi:hypothetical protein
MDQDKTKAAKNRGKKKKKQGYHTFFLSCLLLLLLIVLVLCFLHAESFISASETESPDCSKPPSPGALQQPRFLARWLAGWLWPVSSARAARSVETGGSAKKRKRKKGEKEKRNFRKGFFFQFCDFCSIGNHP